MTRISLDDDSVDRIARRVVVLLGHKPDVLTASQAAEYLGVARDWVYEHSRELGASRLGDGPKAALRFERDRLDAYLVSKRKPEPSFASPPPRKRAEPPASSELFPLGRKVPLLPIRPAVPARKKKT